MQPLHYRCFFACHASTPCDGPMDMAHVIPKQRLKRELRGASPDIIRRAIWHPAVWVWGCRRHHGDFDNRVLRLGRGDLPAAVEVYAEALGVGWSLDNDYGVADLAGMDHMVKAYNAGFAEQIDRPPESMP